MLKIAEDLSLPIDTVTQSMAILARKGAGKSYTGSVLAEEVIKAKVPIVILDPTGAWWGLRSSPDGTKEGLPVTIFGGDHGDMALEPTMGALFAEVVLEHPGAYIFDFSAFTSKTAEQTFAASFLEHLYRGKKPETGPLLLVVDEADFFAPQQPRDKGPQVQTLGALESIVRRGRIKGLGCLLITQRAAVLNKNVLTQTEILIIMQTTGPQDRAALKEWVTGNATNEEAQPVLDTLASLKTGEAWIWSPAFLKTLTFVGIRRRTTFDSGKTPGAGETAIVPTEFAKVDLGALGERIATVQVSQAENDPKRLRARISQLERELRERPEPEPKIIEVPVLSEEERMMLGPLAETMRDYGQNIIDKLDKLTPIGTVTSINGKPASGTVVAVEPVSRETPKPTVIPGTYHNPRAGEAETALTKAERTILSALAQYPEGVSKKRLSLLTGYSADAGHTKNTIGGLRSRGYMNRGEPIQITPEGLAVLGPYEALPAPGPELVAYWLPKLDKAQRAMLEAFVAAYPSSLTKDRLGELSGYSMDAGHSKNSLGRIRGLGLVDGWTASEELMG